MKAKTISNDTLKAIRFGLIVAVLLVSAVNTVQISRMKDSVSLQQQTLALAAGGSSDTGAGAATYAQTPSLEILPRGVPDIYGKELGISFDDVSPADPQKADETIGKLGALDTSITLDEVQKKRYIDILYTLNKGIACEYCCGARSVIFETGEPACGCAHSYAMRGLTKYLITKHGSEYTDLQILEETAKWKFLFFPTIMAQKAEIMAQNGIEMTYANIGSNKYRGIEKGAQGGSMVGGC